MLRDNGFIDCYRTVHPDPLKDVGDTWSYLHPADPQGRIDFIFSRGDKFLPISLLDEVQTLFLFLAMSSISSKHVSSIKEYVINDKAQKLD